MAREDKEQSYDASKSDGNYSEADDFQKLDFEDLEGAAGGVYSDEEGISRGICPLCHKKAYRKKTGVSKLSVDFRTGTRTDTDEYICGSCHRRFYE